MEDIISFVLRGCKLAQELESRLGQLNGTDDLLEKCEQIAGAFTAASQGLRAVQFHVATTLHEDKSLSVGPMSSSGGGGVVPLQQAAFVAKGAHAGGSSGLHKSRKRKDESGKRTIEVEAPLHGNMEIPPDDGFTWRKYGQKEILGSLFPRGYYRCTHQRLYNCPAKKQVQRLNHNPRIFQVIYRGHHICHMDSTAPTAAAFPPPPPDPPVTTSADTWLSIQLATSHALSMTTMMSSAGFSAGTTSLSAVVGHGELGGADVADMADAMFNSSAGSVDDHGIDFIFDK